MTLLLGRAALLAALSGTLFGTVDAAACTTAVISARASRTGRPLLWKQRDSPSKANHLAHFRGDRYAFTGLVDSDDSLQLSVWCGVNEAGFAIANNVSYNLRPDSLENRPYEGIVMKQALGQCSTVEDFERMLRTMPQPNGLETNYMVADASGGAACFEVWDYGYERYDADRTPEGYLYRTNFSLSGRPDEGRGYTRYATVGELMAARSTERFTAEWLLDSAGRSFRNAVLGTDLLLEPLPASGLALDVDHIPRPSTTAGIVIELPAAGEAANSSVLWCVLGYTPCSYAVAVWVAAGGRIPAPLRAVAGEPAAADATARALQRTLFPLERDGGEVYIDLRRLRDDILPLVREAEAREFAEGRKLDRKLRTAGFDAEAVAAYNESADKRFRLYRKRIAKYFER